MSHLQCPRCGYNLDTASANSPSHFVPLLYRPDGGSQGQRLPIFIAEMLVTGAILGWMGSRFGAASSLLFLFPLAMGMILAGFVFLGCTWAKVRNPTLVGMVGLLSASMSILSMHYAEYQRTRQTLAQNAEEVPGRIRERLTISPGFGTYLDATAQVGITLTTRSPKGIHLGYAGTWTFWTIELALVASLTFFGGRLPAYEPFCAHCTNWKREQKLGTLRSPSRDVLGVLKRGALSELADHLPSREGGNVILTAFVCPRCREEAPFELRVVSRIQTSKGRTKIEELISLTYPGAALPVLEKLWQEQISETEWGAAA